MFRAVPREGEIYEVVNVGDHTFTVRYGYYSENERESFDPIPIYPCFISQPHYSAEGFPLVTRIQDACEHYRTQAEGEGDGWCADCVYCTGDHDAIGLCECPDRRRTQTP